MGVHSNSINENEGLFVIRFEKCQPFDVFEVCTFNLSKNGRTFCFQKFKHSTTAVNVVCSNTCRCQRTLNDSTYLRSTLKSVV